MPSLKQKFKTFIAKRIIAHRSKKNKLDIEFAETYSLPDDVPEHHNNSFYFTGHADDGHAFLARLAFRGNNTAEVWFALNIPEKGLFNYEQNLDEPGEGISSGPLKFTCLEPAKKWKVQFNSTVKNVEGEENLDIQFEGIFSSDLPLFNFGTDMNPLPMARSLAQEKWSKKFFDSLKAADQVHTEQCGIFEGRYIIEGKETNLNMQAIRDHSYGPRDWNFMVRHIWLIIALEDGTFFNYSLVEYPILKGLKTGFYMKKNKVITAINGTSIKQIRKGKEIPNNFTFEVQLEDGTKIEGECSFSKKLSWVMGESYRITEGLAKYKINGIKGRGIAEFGSNISKK